MAESFAGATISSSEDESLSSELSSESALFLIATAVAFLLDKAFAGVSLLSSDDSSESLSSDSELSLDSAFFLVVTTGTIF
uniref:Nucleolin 2 isoform X4 n=1 Tax=Rhizophora mucronata TaxID=61149 RepID=A0A2P2LPM5_RHIMU